jgi:hypothetical protein
MISRPFFLTSIWEKFLETDKEGRRIWKKGGEYKDNGKKKCS